MFGELITDPVHTVAKIDSTTAVVIGALTFMIATIGINIVANFVSPAFDFSNVAPQQDQLAHRRHDRRGRLGLHHALEPVQQPAR